MSYAKKLLFAALPAAAICAPLHGDEFNAWATGAVDCRIGERAKIGVLQELWFDSSNLYKEETYFSLAVQVTDWLSVGPGFRLEVEEHDRDWTLESRPTFDFTFSGEWNGWRIADRLRFELRCKEEIAREYMRYRNRIRIHAPWKWTQLEINPFASWELYIEDKPRTDARDLYNCNRWQLGVSAQLTENLKLSLFYMIRSKKSGGHWTQYHTPSIELKYSF